MISTVLKNPLFLKVLKLQQQRHILPYDMSMYDNIKFVIPNHYLDLNSRRTVRYYPLTRVEGVPTNEAVEISNELIGNIIRDIIVNINYPCHLHQE